MTVLVGFSISTQTEVLPLLLAKFRGPPYTYFYWNMHVAVYKNIHVAQLAHYWGQWEARELAGPCRAHIHLPNRPNWRDWTRSVLCIPLLLCQFCTRRGPRLI